MYLFSLSLLILSKLNLSLGVECVIRDFEEVQAIVASCKIIVINNLVVPGGEQLTLDLTYGTVLIFRGTTLFEVFPWKGPLVKISGYGLNVVGEKGSVLDGQGMLHWDGLGQWGAITKPRFMEINAFNSIFDNILVKDCPIGCVQVKHSENVVLTNWRIDNLHGDEVGEQCIITEFQNVSRIVANCTDIVIDNLLVPGGHRWVLNLTDGSTLTFRGTTKFEHFAWHGPLLKILGNNITVIGEKNSSLDGQGPLYWDGLGQWGPTIKPKFLEIIANNSYLSGVVIKNCPVACVFVRHSDNITLADWKIDNSLGDMDVAPVNKSGHNTDGIAVKDSTNILIRNSEISNQDDCVVVNSGKQITVRHVTCRGSHGLSLSVNNATVEDVTFEHSSLMMADNGIHIKTHVDSGNGLIKNVFYSNITMTDCKKYGISVQQNYRNVPPGVHQDGPPRNNTPIHNVTLANIFGSVGDKAVPVFILCATGGCFDWKWQEVKLLGGTKDNCTNFLPPGYIC